jgi:hypothetical protein
MLVAKAGRPDYSPSEADGSRNENMCIMKIYCGFEVFMYMIRYYDDPLLSPVNFSPTV